MAIPSLCYFFCAVSCRRRLLDLVLRSPVEVKMNWGCVLRLQTIVLVAIFGAGCQSVPDQTWARDAADLGFARSSILGTGFVHTLLTSSTADAIVTPANPVFVYFDGDGRPWNSLGTDPRSNPDPIHALAVELAATQQGNTYVLGRPCYFGHAADVGCDASLWTAQRYSEPVVASMAAALQQIAADHASPPIVLIGYSGGGTLALLVAERVPAVAAVVTVAANLDTTAWTKHHGYLPLTGSLDPLAARARAPGCELHLAADLDTVVPLSQTWLSVARRPGALLWIELDADHACCWKDRWPAIMQRVRQQLDSANCLSRPAD